MKCGGEQARTASLPKGERIHGEQDCKAHLSEPSAGGGAAC